MSLLEVFDFDINTLWKLLHLFKCLSSSCLLPRGLYSPCWGSKNVHTTALVCLSLCLLHFFNCLCILCFVLDSFSFLAFVIGLIIWFWFIQYYWEEVKHNYTVRDGWRKVSPLLASMAHLHRSSEGTASSYENWWYICRCNSSQWWWQGS